MIHFLASIPRSGSTLLASLLNQRDDTFVSNTSNLGSLIGSVVEAYDNDPATKASQFTEDDLFRSLKSLVKAHYIERDEPVIFDKGRQWPVPKNMETLGKVLEEPIKIVATVRPIAECIASFYAIDKSDMPIKEWIKESQLFTHLMKSYHALRAGYEKYPNQFCIVEYDNLVTHPQVELNRISDFLGLKHKVYNPVIEQVEENDNAWGVKDLHKLAQTIENQGLDTKGILGDELYNHFQGGEFWNDKPEPERGKEPLDFSLEAGLRGEFDKAWQILKQEEKLAPENNRVAFNLGFYEMQRGNLQKAHKYLDRGREEEVFGNKHIGTKKPIWNGERNCTVLMNMEGGFGDHFHAIRYAKLIAEYGNRVIISTCLPMAEVLKQVEGVEAIVRHEVALGVHFDYWVPSMSAVVPLGLEYSDLSGEPYIPRLCESEGKVGVKWLGNPKFEHEQHRVFPEDLMFDAVKDEDCICLQKELGEPPEWMEQPSLEMWKDTQLAISRCDLVITSCTGVAHLAGAMGIETWVVVPVLPYYLWALPGDKTPHYDSVTLFRQVKYGKWEAPFKKIKQALIQRRVVSWSKATYDEYGDTTRAFIEA